MFKFAHLVVALALGLAATVAPAPKHHLTLPAPQPWSAADVATVAAENQDIPAAVAAQREAEAEAAAKAAADAAAKAADEQRQAAAVYAAAHPVQPAAAAPATYAAGSIQQIIHDAFAPYGQAGIDWGERVAKCESGYNPRAYNPAGPYYGLFQFLMSTFKATPYGGGDIYDPVANAKAAAWKYGQGGQSAWGCN